MGWTVWGKPMPKTIETATETQHRVELARMRAYVEQLERRAADDERLLRARAEQIEFLQAQLGSKPRMSHAGPGWQKRPA